MNKLLFVINKNNNLLTQLLSYLKLTSKYKIILNIKNPLVKYNKKLYYLLHKNCINNITINLLKFLKMYGFRWL